MAKRPTQFSFLFKFKLFAIASNDFELFDSKYLNVVIIISQRSYDIFDVDSFN